MVESRDASIRVAVAIITDERQRLLITQRAAHSSHAGFWEFPGGKLELNESPEQALFREVTEEVGLEILAYRYLGEVQHQYDSRHVTLFGYHVVQYRGEAACLECQTGLRWVNINDLVNYEFPAANQQLIEILRIANGSYSVRDP